MPKFKVGDRVRCIAAQDGNDFIVGQFQSTLPHGSDNELRKRQHTERISIHAPSRERRLQ